MTRRTTRHTAEERRPATARSGPILSPDAPPEGVVSQCDGDISTRVETRDPGPTGAGPTPMLDGNGPTGGLAPPGVRGNPSPEAAISRYEIVHAAVGGHYEGELVDAGTFTDEQSRRLLKAGAIIPLYKAD